MNTLINNNFIGFELNNFDVKTLKIESKALEGNSLGDLHHRYIPTLVPKNVGRIHRVILVLAGFSGVGSKYFNINFKQQNFPQVVDQLVAKNKAPNCVYAFIDAITYWGGSQFINSEGTGKYEDFIVKEIRQAVIEALGVSEKPQHWCIMGGSSGGYGSLHLVSQFPDLFGFSVAIAPDSFFEMSLLPEIYTALPIIKKFNGVDGVRDEIEKGRFLSRRDAHTVLNAIGMGSCYAPNEKKNTEILWPVDTFTGEVDKTIWKLWKAHDPLEFLKKRKVKIQKAKGFYLDVGSRDQYFLQYGTRQIYNILKHSNQQTHYSEFSGNHFDISNRRPQALNWLLKKGFK